MPPVVRACVGTWQQRNAGWDVRLLSGDDLCNWADPILDEPRARALSPYRLSELARLSLLAQHGGVWVDATCYCARPLDEWLPDSLGSGFFAFDRPGVDRLAASWFLASVPEGYIPRRMWDALRGYYIRRVPPDRAWRRFALRRLNGALNRSPRTTSLWFVPPLPQLGLSPYFAFHYTFNRLVRVDRDFAAIWERTPKFSADGPHGLRLHGFERRPSPELLGEIEERRTPVYKLDWRVDPTMLHPASTLNVLLGTRVT